MTTLVPGVSVTISDLASASLTTASPIVVFGIKTSGGSLAVNTPTRVFSADEAAEFAGRGSQAHQMVAGVFSAYRNAEVTLVNMAAPAGVAATKTLTYSGTATTATSILLQIEDQTVEVPVSIGDNATTIAAAATTALAPFTNLHVTSGSALGVQTLTARSIGAHGNMVRARVIRNTPGVSIAIATGVTGTGDPNLTTAIAALGGSRYKYWVLPDVSATNLAAAITELDDRWTRERQIDGHAIAGVRDTVGNLASFGLGEDTKHVSVFGDPYTPANPWVWAGKITGLRARVENPRLTLSTDDIPGLIAPPDSEFLLTSERLTLLTAGIATFQYVNGRARVERFVTLYKTNALAQPSTVFQDAEVKLTASECRTLQVLVLRGEIGKILVNQIGEVQYGVDVANKIIDAEGVRKILLGLNTEVFQRRAWTDGDAASTAFFGENLQVVRSGQNELTFTCTLPITGTNYVNEGELQVVTAFSIAG
jgi:phage tail sheath gpL-like